jgi:phosphoribosylamine-glycine ligase
LITSTPEKYFDLLIQNPVDYLTFQLEDLKEKLDLPNEISGKKGIAVLNDSKKIKKLINLSCEATTNGYVLFEEFIYGDDVSVVGFTKQGEIYFSILLDEKNIIRGNILEGYGYQGPSKFTNTEVHKIILENSAMLIKSLDINSSPFSFAFRIDNNGIPYLIEAHLELVGDLIFNKLLPAIYNTNFIEHVIKYFMGDFQLKTLRQKNFVSLKYIDANKLKCSLRKKELNRG